MEGQPVWFMGAVIAIFGLMWLSGVPALAAIGFLLARRPHQALKLFATALLCEAILGAGLCILDLPTERDIPIPLGLTGLSLLLAGAGQFVGALRSPRTYAVSLAFAVGAVVAVVVPIQGWQHLPVAVTSLALALASVIIAVLLPVGTRPTETEEAEAKGPGRTSI